MPVTIRLGRSDQRESAEEGFTGAADRLGRGPRCLPDCKEKERPCGGVNPNLDDPRRQKGSTDGGIGLPLSSSSSSFVAPRPVDLGFLVVSYFPRLRPLRTLRLGEAMRSVP